VRQLAGFGAIRQSFSPLYSMNIKMQFARHPTGPLERQVSMLLRGLLVESDEFLGLSQDGGAEFMISIPG
jgi:hypothetical protein